MLTIRGKLSIIRCDSMTDKKIDIAQSLKYGNLQQIKTTKAYYHKGYKSMQQKYFNPLTPDRN